MSEFQVGFVFPSDFINNKKPDEFYENEYKLFKDAGYPVYLINIDDLDSSRVYPSLGDHRLIYRGWMLDEERYKKMFKKLDGQMFVNTEEYLKSHHLPGWYENIKKFTIESVVTTEEDAVDTFKSLGWDKAFMKDYVKSLKTGKGSIVDSPEDVQRALEDIHKFKGFVEKGIVFRAVKEFEPDSEKRFFVLNGKVFSSTDDEDMYYVAEKASHKHDAFFYSIDVARNKDGELFVVEIGDGQVSDTVGWNLKGFVEMFQSIKKQNRLKI
jgi:hypothetical protein